MRKIATFILLFAITLVASEGGPDEFGYRWIDSDEPGGPAYEWREIDWIGVSLGWHDTEDDAMYELTLPQPFTFYGQEYTTLHICSNGWMCLGEYSGWARTSLPNIPDEDEPNALIAPFSMDLNPRNSPGEVYYYWDESEKKFIVEFDEIVEYSEGPIPYVFEVILDFRAQSVLFQYAVTGATSRNCVIGIENETGEIGLQYGTDEDVHNGLAILFAADVIVGAPYSSGFETYEERSGFEAEDTTEWQCGEPIGPGPGTTHSGSYCWGTNLFGSYGYLMDAYLYTPMFNAGTANHPYIDFWKHTSAIKFCLICHYSSCEKESRSNYGN